MPRKPRSIACTVPACRRSVWRCPKGSQSRSRYCHPHAARGDDPVVDADHVAAHVEHRSARIARIDRGIGLDVVIVGAGAGVAVDRRDDPRSHRSAQAKRVADRDHPVTGARLGRFRRTGRKATGPWRRSSAPQDRIRCRARRSALVFVTVGAAAPVTSSAAPSRSRLMTWLLVTHVAIGRDDEARSDRLGQLV